MSSICLYAHRLLKIKIRGVFRGGVKGTTPPPYVLYLSISYSLHISSLSLKTFRLINPISIGGGGGVKLPQLSKSSIPQRTHLCLLWVIELLESCDMFYHPQILLESFHIITQKSLGFERNTLKNIQIIFKWGYLCILCTK